jgi:F0F1-type ATP synthase assembly protein I
MTDTSAAAPKTRRTTAFAQRMTNVLVRPNSSTSVDQGLGQGMEMAITVAVFLGLGWLLDLAFGTQPAFMIGLVVFSVVGQSVKMWFAYDARMKTLEAERRQAAVAHQQTAPEFSPESSPESSSNTGPDQ